MLLAGPLNRRFPVNGATHWWRRISPHAITWGGKAIPRPGGFQHPVVPPLYASGMTSMSYPGPGPGLIVSYIGMFVPDSDSVCKIEMLWEVGTTPTTVGKIHSTAYCLNKGSSQRQERIG